MSFNEERWKRSGIDTIQCLTWESDKKDKNTIEHPKRELRGQPFPSR